MREWMCIYTTVTAVVPVRTQDVCLGELTTLEAARRGPDQSRHLPRLRLYFQCAHARLD